MYGALEKEVPSTMAIQDRNLSVGTKLYARYKGQTHRAEVIEKDGGTAYRLSDGREFKSPSAAGTAVTEKACNGWAFWSVGDGAENTGPVTSTKARPAEKITPAPKPTGKQRGRKGHTEEPPATDDQDGDEARDDAPTGAQDDGQPLPHAPRAGRRSRASRPRPSITTRRTARRTRS